MRADNGSGADLVPADLVAALERIAATDRLLVALDFDGTLSPEVDDPAEARAIPEATMAVHRLLEAANTRVALISGRAAASLLHVSKMPDTVMIIGSHGAETRLKGAEVQLALDDDERRRVRLLFALLTGIAEPFEGVWVESKPAGFALHTRLATEDTTRAVTAQALRKTQAEIGGLTVRHGKNVLEFSVKSTTKGEAIALLRTHTNASAVFFAGDDVTDEDGFSALEHNDLGLKVGSGETIARVRVPGPAQLAATLHKLADLRVALASGSGPAGTEDIL